MNAVDKFIADSGVGNCSSDEGEHKPAVVLHIFVFENWSVKSEQIVLEALA